MSTTYFATLCTLTALLAAVPSTMHSDQGLIVHKALSLDMSIAMAQARSKMQVDRREVRHYGARYERPDYHRDAG